MAMSGAVFPRKSNEEATTRYPTVRRRSGSNHFSEGREVRA
jgi:hypothetical protein